MIEIENARLLEVSLMPYVDEGHGVYPITVEPSARVL